MLTGPCNLSPGDPVMVLLPKLPEWWLLNVACARAGRIVVVAVVFVVVADVVVLFHRLVCFAERTTTSVLVYFCRFI